VSLPVLRKDFIIDDVQIILDRWFARREDTDNE
jgi:indole-3-glycerol phosphate synthase